jgi:hypothetical protein
MATQERTLDCSDIDQYLGKPIESSPIREPISNTDIRRWVHAMHYANLLHFDRDYAAQSRFGKLVAPQSFPIVMDDGHGSAPACVGCIPDSHLLFAGDEWWFYGPRVSGGDVISNERIPFDYTRQEHRLRADLLPARRQFLPQPERRTAGQAALHRAALCGGGWRRFSKSGRFRRSRMDRRGTRRAR